MRLTRKPQECDRDFVIPRGKLKGYRVRDIPSEHLNASWAGWNGTASNARIAAILKDEMELRGIK